MTSTRLTASRDIPASPTEIFAVLVRPYGHVAIDASGMLQSATGDPVSAVGDQFTVHMDREALGDVDLGKYDVQVKITEYVPDVEIAWTVLGVIEPPIGHVYGYRLEPIESGTRVVSYYDWSDAHPKWAPIFPVISESALKATLGILERAVRLGYPDPTTD